MCRTHCHHSEGLPSCQEHDTKCNVATPLTIVPLSISYPFFRLWMQEKYELMRFIVSSISTWPFMIIDPPRHLAHHPSLHSEHRVAFDLVSAISPTINPLAKLPTINAVMSTTIAPANPKRKVFLSATRNTSLATSWSC